MNWYYKGEKSLVQDAIICARATGSVGAKFSTLRFKNGEPVEVSCVVRREGHQDETFRPVEGAHA